MATDLIPGTAATVEYSGAAVEYTITQDGMLNVKAYGAGGAGGTYFGSTRTDRKGGAGGKILYNLRVFVGDVIKVEVGQGGQKPESVAGNGTAPCNGGPGGWPDGGYGGRSSANTNTGFGGGGGSTRVYRNNVLVGIAGGGGGATGFYHGGNGGGVNGLQSFDAVTCGTGGTRFAGGGGDATTARTKGNGVALGGGYGGASRTVAESTAGGGGGGGWWGGGSNAGWGSGSHGSGGGGSGLAGDGITGTINAGTQDTGHPTPDPDGHLPAGRAVGGTCATTLAAVTAGGNGWVRLYQEPMTSVAMVEGVNTASFTGYPQEFVAGQAGTITLKMWGGAGSGGSYLSAPAGTRTDRKGGAGGYTTMTFNVLAGDELLFYVGEGGDRPRSVIVGARGGWPDGGHGGHYTGETIAMGSGGGSTRVYLNGTLIGVAGAGGGSTGYYHGGPGGGTTGGQTLDNTSTCGTGGTQSAGGSDRGAFQFGANGDNVPTYQQSSFGGSGAGGGYYGGGTNKGSIAGNNGSGGGGSGYVASGYTGSMTSGGLDNGTPHNETERPSTVAVGGTNATTLAGVTNGGNGYVHFVFAQSGEEGEAEGILGTVTMTSPEGGATGASAPVGNIGTITTSAIDATGGGAANIDALQGPIEVTMFAVAGSAGVSAGGTGNIGTVQITQIIEGSAEAQVFADGDIGTINVLSLIEAGPITEAIIILDLLLLIDPVEFLMELETTVTGAVNLPDAGGDLQIDTVNLYPVEGYYGSEDQEAFGDIGEVQITQPVEGYAAEAFEAVLDSVITFTNLMTATVTGAVNVLGPLDLTIGMIPPEGSVQSADMETVVDLPSIAIDPVWGVALTGDDVVLAVGQFVPPVSMEWTNTNDIQARGAALAVPVLDHWDENPAERYICQVKTSAVKGAASGGADKAVFFDLTITFASPQGLTERAQNILAPIGTIYVRRALGGAGDNPSHEGDALAGLDLVDQPIRLTAPDAAFSTDGTALGLLTPLVVLVEPPEGSGDPAQDLAYDLPGPIVLSAPEGMGWAVDPDSTAEADLTAVVMLTAPEAYMQSLVLVDIPGPVRLYPIESVFKVIRSLGDVVLVRRVDAEAILRRVENGEAVCEDVVERTVILRG